MLIVKILSLFLGLAVLQDAAAVPTSGSISGTRSIAHTGAYPVTDIKLWSENQVAPLVNGGGDVVFPEKDGMNLSQTDTIEKRWFGVLYQVASLVVGTVARGFFMGMGNLFAIAAAGQEILNNFGVIDAAINGVFSIWSRGFTITSGFRRRSEFGDKPVYGLIQRPDVAKSMDGKVRGFWTTLESHIPINPNMSLHQAAMSANNGTEFLHIATLYRQGLATHTLHYRRAHPDDLGFANNGTYHHARSIQVSAKEPGVGAGKRAEVDNSGVVMDYLWKQGRQDLWTDTYFDTKNYDQDAADAAAGYMREFGSEVSCADVVEGYIDTSNNSGWEAGENSGLLAFGWNNQAFAFNGRAGEWVNDCTFV